MDSVPANEKQAYRGLLGQDFTDTVIKSMGPKTSPRLREVMTSFIQHIHDFARETNLTVDEWAAAVQMINWAGQMSNDSRNEGQLMCDIIGLESLVDDITYQAAVESNNPATTSAILGPFWRETPIRKNGTSISSDTPADAKLVFMHGKVSNASTGAPVANATVDIWQASTNGLYEQQDVNQKDHNLRGKFVTDSNGEYSLYCLRPTPYPVPNDGPSGKLLTLLDRHEWRPAHIHLIVLAEGYKSITTQVFDRDSKYLEDDSVFAVKEGLTATFTERKGDPQAKLELVYNINLAPAS
ncbi:Putative catechol dioxygenase [Tolypocladium paradoxum]|uniref:Catechol dioxygenase n=1 Tax=Tolypocladium paradoxum TaxID=94208 RepID=A0A2S4KW34_9HYPO|nr:Putative catechol dioxygenase [Tolypocladium paradoxum]